MAIFTLGLNHKRAPIFVREQFYLNDLQQDLLLSELRCLPEVLEAFILSTCNRTELYINVLGDDITPQKFIERIVAIKNIPFEKSMLEHFYCLKNDAMIDHLLRVVCGLDSLVIGEKQILGQVKKAVEKAQKKQMFSKHFNLLSALAIRAGKKAQSETDISYGGSSVSWAAIKMAEIELGTLEGKRLLLIGAGKMGELALDQICGKGFEKLYLMNRTHETAEALAKQFEGEAIPFCDIKDIFPTIDVCICASDAPHYVLDYPLVARLQSNDPQQKIVLVDISMPRNIDPRIGTLPFVKLFHIDDLNKPIEENLQKRAAAVTQVEKIIADKFTEFHLKLSKIKENQSDDLTESIVIN